MFFEEFNLVFLTTESAWPVLKGKQGSDILENFEVNFSLYGHENYFVKRNLCIYKWFIDV